MNYSITGRFLMLNENGTAREAIGELFVKYPFIMVRMVLAIVLFCAIVVVVSYLKRKTYIHMATELDEITGLINWDRFKKEAEIILKKNPENKYALIHFDIDKFKTINDVYGTSGGNRVLKAIALDVKSLLNNGELVTRIYADAFSVLIKYHTDEEIKERVEEFNKVIRGGTVTFNLNVYFGIYKIEEDINFDIMSDRANLAKQSVKGNVVRYYAFFDQKIRDRILREKNIENNMHAALEAGEFVAYLQPQYSTRTGKIVSAESLVRWNDPIHQVVSPGEFIELFERNKFIINLDNYIWEQVCKLLRKWIDSGKDPIPVSVNVSPVHFTNGDLVTEITEIVDRYRIPATLIELEITESTFLEDKEGVIAIINQLHQLGYKIAMDDFGSGYSSLNLLNILPIDVLKIDKEFLRSTVDSQKGKIVMRNVINMAKELGMTVITEGVETKEEVDFLFETECDKIQGYYYSKPLSIIDFENKYYV